MIHDMTYMDKKMTNDIEQLILEVLEDWEHTQLNIASESARRLLTKAIIEKLKLAAEHY